MMIKGLYAITPDELDTAKLIYKVTAALDGGASLLQYRNKIAGDKLKIEQAEALFSLCKTYKVPFIINDSIALCEILDADGVHIGADDGNIAEIRQKLGTNKILGASCYNRFDLAVNAQQAGATYVAFGACFASSTKPHAPVASLDLFTQTKNILNKPSVAIGGINLNNAATVINAGADSIAVINALFQSNNITQTAKAFSQLFNHSL